MTKSTKKRFDPQFRLEAAQLVVDQKYKLKEACEAMGVSKSTMESWVRKLRAERSGKAPVDVAITSDQLRIQELERKLKRVEEEKEILKKATALTMSDSVNNSR